MNADLKVFVAEDNPSDVFLIREALKQHGVAFDMRVVDDGEAVMEAFTAFGSDGTPCPDIILLDLNLPKSTGTEALPRLRQNPACSKVPVIVLTSSDSPIDRQNAERLGATRFFRKPSDLDEFLTIGGLIKEICAGAESR
jgi:CheY-like chemotaxis protein